MLGQRLRTAGYWTVHGRRIGARHDTMHARLLRDAFVPSLWTRGRRRHTRGVAAIPDAAHIVAGNDLRETASFDVSDLDEARVEEENVGRVPSDVFRCPFPFDGPHLPARITVPVDV